MKIATVLGARPQFIKAAVIHRAIVRHNEAKADRRLIESLLIHTGQHYDYLLSQVFFDQLDLPEPDYHLGVGPAGRGRQLGLMAARATEVLALVQPDIVLVYGDTNSTVAGALAAAGLNMPIAHIEAGLRSFDPDMPEERNRLVTDHLSRLLFCPTATAVANLEQEEVKAGVHQVGDVTYDSLLFSLEFAQERSAVMNKLKLKPKGYLLVTVHRADNADDPARLRNIIEALVAIGEKAVLPLHPRTKKTLAGAGLLKEYGATDKLMFIEPLSYFDMIVLTKQARVVLTDSGGLQREAYLLKVPCLTLRQETEWVETLADGANILAGAEKEKIIKAYARVQQATGGQFRDHFGDGDAGGKIVEKLVGFLAQP